MNRIFANFNRQLWPNKELIIVLNRDSLNLRKWKKAAKSFPNVSVYQLPATKSLGACLNYAITKCKLEFVAKFDDDDFYAPRYLTGMFKAFARSGADIVGKRSYYTYIQSSKLLIERFPNQQNCFVRRVAGATLTFRKKLCDHVRFDHVSFGEDIRFLTACLKKGFRVYSNNRYNYVCIRRKQKKYHTWQPSNHYLLRKSRVITRTENYENHILS